MAKEDAEYVHFKDEEGAVEALGIKEGNVPAWLEQRYKSKFPRKKVTQEEKEANEKAKAEEVKAQKRKATDDAKESLMKVIPSGAERPEN